MTFESNPKGEVPFFQRLYFWTLIWLHVLGGIFTLLFIFPSAKTSKKNYHIQRWSKELLRIFGIELRVRNQQALPVGTYLLASNHISWMDIHAINAFKPIRFVAKSEVRGWPIFGWMALQLGTVFIKRDSQRHAHLVVGEMGRELQSDSICIFPEGTSTNGESVRTFKPNLFESAIAANVPLCSLAIRYISKETRHRTDIAAFVGEMGLLESMSKILKNRNLIVELSFYPPPSQALEHPFDRKFLASYSENLIRKHVEGL